MMTHFKPTCSMRHSRQSGFTLMELMIAVGIVALISAIAIPAFIDHMKKSRRSDARGLLLEIVAKQEQYFPNNQRYTDDFTQLGNLTAKEVTATSVTSENGYYKVTIRRPTLYTYTLTATPTGAQASDSCTKLTIDQDGTRGVTDPIDTVTGSVVAQINACW